MESGRVPIYALWLRICHIVHAFSAIMLMSSGWAIYNADPLYDFLFPKHISLGLYLTEALRWHFLLAWILLLTSVIYSVSRLVLNLGGPSIRHFSLMSILDTLYNAMRFSLFYRRGEYNPLQRLMYTGIFILSLMLVFSGVALWKPVQFNLLIDMFFGYEVVRHIHFWLMIVLFCFLIVHVCMILIHPSTLMNMIFGATRKKLDSNVKESKP